MWYKLFNWLEIFCLNWLARTQLTRKLLARKWLARKWLARKLPTHVGVI